MTDRRDDDHPPLPVRVGTRLLVVAEDAVYVSIAVLLALSAVVVTVRSAGILLDRSTKSGPDVMVDVLDSLLLVFIFVELLYAVRTTLKERQIVAEPFLIAGILASIKEIIVLSVKAANDYVDKGPQFARAMVEVGLLGGLVVLLAGAAVLLRKKENEPSENSS
ncbi:MAG: hypothetical protein JWN77_2452 [Frankiales bacterium]|jgi:uncharacterized membrane protein (DUF373 family)|nr:hypothetical protein [Frankiales bacterium]